MKSDSISQERCLSVSVISIINFPSNPDRVNAFGRYFILETLRNLAASDQEKWQVVVDKISDGLKKDVQFLKLKHFGKEEGDVDISPRLEKINEFIVSLDLLIWLGKRRKKRKQK